MHKYILHLFLLSSSLCSYCASWADIVKGKAPKEKQHPSTKNFANPLNLIEIGRKALDQGQQASTILNTLNPIFTMPVEPQIKAQAFNMVAFAFSKENNLSEELVFLCNELAVSYNEGLLVDYDNTTVLPKEQLPSVHRLCSLLKNGQLATFERIYKHDEYKDDFLNTIIRSGYISRSPHATHLLAESGEKSGNYAHALALYESLPDSYAQSIRDSIMVTRLQHAQTNPLLLSKLFNQIAHDPELQSSVTKKLSEMNLTGISQSFWEYVHKNSSGKEKATAAFELSNLLRNSNSKMADIYLCVAAGAGDNNACKKAFNLGLNEPDEHKAIKYFEAAALGKHVGALLKCGNYYKNIANKNETNTQQAAIYLKKAKTYLEQAAALNSPAARLELALMLTPSTGMFHALEILAHDSNFSLKSDAQYYLGKIFLNIAKFHNKKSGDIAERNTYLKKAEQLLKQSAQDGNSGARIAYPLCLLKRATITTPAKKQKELLNRTEIMLQNELKCPTNKQKALIGLAKLNHFKKNMTQVVDLLLEAYQLNPTDAYTNDAISLTIEKMRDKKEYDYIQKLSHGMKELNPACRFAHLHMGIVALEHTKDLSAARAFFKTAGKLGYSTAYKNLGITYFNNATISSDYDYARKYYERALELAPNDNELMHLLGHTHHALKNYMEAKKYFSMGAHYKNPDSLAGLANYWHRGFAGPNDPIIAHELYKQAASQYIIQGNAERAHFCTHMSFILQHQHFKCINSPSDAKTLVAEYQVMIKDLKKIAHLSDQNPTLTNEAWYALAFQYESCAKHYSTTAKKKELYLLALKMINFMPNQTHLEGQLLKANIIQELITQKLLDETIPYEDNLAHIICDLYDKAIENLELNRPLSQTLVDTYNNYASYQLDSAKNSEKALEFFHKAAALDSVEAMIHLCIFYKKNNPEEARIWLEKAMAIDPESPLVQITQKYFVSLDKHTKVLENNSLAESSSL